MAKVKTAKFKKFAQKIEKLNAGKLSAKKTVKLLINLSRNGIDLEKIYHNPTTYSFKADYVTQQLIGSEHIRVIPVRKPISEVKQGDVLLSDELRTKMQCKKKKPCFPTTGTGVFIMSDEDKMRNVS